MVIFPKKRKKAKFFSTTCNFRSP